MAEHQSTSDQPETTAHEHTSDTVSLLGREITIYGGIYTVVFIGLAVLTLIEVTLGSLGESWTAPVLIAMSVAKAVLVVMYYMHLRTDSRIFLMTLLIPLAIALLAVLYLLAVPITGY